jgi:hypothetical protein
VSGFRRSKSGRPGATAKSQSFTPVEWESPAWPGKSKTDPSLKSFIFALKSPHNFPARKFALKAEEKDEAIVCASSCGPHFRDIRISNNCNARARSGSYVGWSYANYTGVDGNTVLAGSEHFRVKEIEVFEIADQTALPNPARLPRKSRFSRNRKKVANQSPYRHLYTINRLSFLTNRC